MREVTSHSRDARVSGALNANFTCLASLKARAGAALPRHLMPETVIRSNMQGQQASLK